MPYTALHIGSYVRNILVHKILANHGWHDVHLVDLRLSAGNRYIRSLMTILLWGPRHHNIIIVILYVPTMWSFWMSLQVIMSIIVLDVLAGYHANSCPQCQCAANPSNLVTLVG